MSECGFVPFPGNGAYGHWSCDRARWHLGRHRFRNYTIGRVPRVWRVRRLVHHWRWHRRQLRQWASISSLAAARSKIHADYRRLLFPTRYDPVP